MSAHAMLRSQAASSRPVILISPCTERRGTEFSDVSVSLSNRYPMAVSRAGGLPCIAPVLSERSEVAEMVRRVDGVMLTGGNDVQTGLYRRHLPPHLKRKLGPPDPQRDLMELLLVDEVFRQRKPLLAICRGHQILNVALGGTLLVDIGTQKPGATEHERSDRKDQLVHGIRIEPHSLLAAVMGKKHLRVNSSHHQAVDRIATILRPTAVSDDGIVEALELDASAKNALPYLLSVQFHPERLVDRHKEFGKLFASFVRSCESREL
jgi:putative glutamine amidotransferase